MTAPLLSVRRLDAYYNTAHVLFDAALEIGLGTTVAMLGRNGAGKSTLLKCIAGADGVRRQGRIAFQDREIDKLAAFRIATLGVALVPEDRRIFTALTVEENIVLGGSASTPVPTSSRCCRSSGTAMGISSAVANSSWWPSLAQWPATRCCSSWTSLRLGSRRSS
jgi:ABC-type branched-subunit amino acid transport system ATPase component